jgi:hypothetical protein
MNSSKSVIVVASGCPAELIQELLSGRILPSHRDVAVLLPPEEKKRYDHLLDSQRSFRRAQFFPSPGQRSFSMRHLNWLRANLRSSGNTYLLIPKSPFQDTIIALISLTVLMFSGKTITLLLATPEAVIDLNGQGFSERWISQELNLKILAREFSRICWFLNPWNILYFLMFGGLILRQSLLTFVQSLVKKGCENKKRPYHK